MNYARFSNIATPSYLKKQESPRVLNGNNISSDLFSCVIIQYTRNNTSFFLGASVISSNHEMCQFFGHINVTVDKFS